MIIRDKTDNIIEALKAQLNLSGDVYMINHLIESLDSHNRLYGTDFATIEEAEQDRLSRIEAEKLALSKNEEIDA